MEEYERELCLSHEPLASMTVLHTNDTSFCLLGFEELALDSYPYHA